MSTLIEGNKPTIAAFLQGALSAGLLSQAFHSTNLIIAWIIVFAAGFGTYFVFEFSMSYFPGGRRNPLSAATIDEPQIGIKAAVWAAALTGTLLIYGAAVWAMWLYAGPFS